MEGRCSEAVWGTMVSMESLCAGLGDAAGPCPEEDASDEVWNAWMEAVAFDSMLAGMVSRPGEPRDREYVSRLRQMLESPRLRATLGDRVHVAHALVQRLSDRASGH